MMDDLDRIMEVMEAGFDPLYGEAWTRRQVSDTLILPTGHYLLAGPDGSPPSPSAPTAGFALSRRIAGEEELLLIAVRPEWRGRGIGGRLLDRLIAAAQSDGVQRLFLEMRDGNPAESLYRRHGFTNVGRRERYYRRGEGPARDAITFARQCQ